MVLIPYGGGTSVTYALIPPQNEKRMIVSVDMHEMCSIKWIDRANMTACTLRMRVRVRSYSHAQPSV